MLQHLPTFSTCRQLPDPDRQQQAITLYKVKLISYILLFLDIVLPQTMTHRITFLPLPLGTTWYIFENRRFCDCAAIFGEIM